MAAVYGACALGMKLNYRWVAVAGFALIAGLSIYIITIPLVLGVFAGVRSTFARVQFEAEKTADS
jgi:hypothetical protein